MRRQRRKARLLCQKIYFPHSLASTGARGHTPLLSSLAPADGASPDGRVLAPTGVPSAWGPRTVGSTTVAAPPPDTRTQLFLVCCKTRKIRKFCSPRTAVARRGRSAANRGRVLPYYPAHSPREKIIHPHFLFGCAVQAARLTGGRLGREVGGDGGSRLPGKKSWLA